MGHTFDVGFAGFVMLMVKTRRCLDKRERRERERCSSTEPPPWSPSQFSCTVQQDGEPTSAPINNLYKLPGTGRFKAALSLPTALADPDHMHITHTLDVSH